MYECNGCVSDYIPVNEIPDNQLGLFQVDGEQLLMDLDTSARDFTTDEGVASRFHSTGLQNIMIADEIDTFFEAM